MPGTSNSGANKKPTAMKVLEGTYRKDRANLNEPAGNLVKIAPAPHLELNEFGMQEWARSSRELIGYGVLSHADLTALSAMCYEWGEYVDCGVRIKENRAFDVSIPVADMDPDQRVEWMKVKYLASRELRKLRKEHLEAFHKMAQQFGLTPASKSKVSSAGKQEVDPLDGI